MLAPGAARLDALHLEQASEAPGDAAQPIASPPASSCSTGLATGGRGSISGAQSAAPEPCGHAHRAASAATGSCGARLTPASHAGAPREWLYRLVTFPGYFTPCPSCTNSRTPKREQLLTQFDTQAPYSVFCSTCPDIKDRVGVTLLQVRRSAFKDVVKATDIARFGCDASGVQQYTLNGSKVIYLNREAAPERKATASSAPAQCSVDGRAMMDKTSLYCSIKCKLHAEDPGFNAWLDTQDPSVRILAQAAANAPPRPTVASSKRAAPADSDASDASLAAMGGGRQRKLARTSSSGASPAPAPAPVGSSGGESRGASQPPAAPPPRRRVIKLPRAGSAPAAPGGVAAAPAGLRTIKTRPTAGVPVPGTGAAAAAAFVQQAGASAFLDAALAGPAGIGDISGSSWLTTDLDAALSSSGPWAGWGGGLASPTSLALGALPEPGWGAADGGSLSPPALIAASGQRGGAAADWGWVSSSPSSGFAEAGCLLMGGGPGLGGLDSGLLLPGDLCLDC